MSDLTIKQDTSIRERVRITVEDILPMVDKDVHFASIKGSIEPTRDLALMMFDRFNLSVDTELQSSGEEFVVKATAWDDTGRKASGLGLCARKEKSGERSGHDALATAETRAMKRAIEALAGGPVINQLIKRVFNGYQTQEARNVTPQNVNGKSGYTPKHGKRLEELRPQIIAEIAEIMKSPFMTDDDRAAARADIKTATDHSKLVQVKRDWEAVLVKRTTGDDFVDDIPGEPAPSVPAKKPDVDLF
jgi:hypothetical protein